MSGASRGPAAKSPEGVCPTCGRRGRGPCPGCGRPFTVQRAAAAGAAPPSSSAAGPVAPLSSPAAGSVRGVLGAGGGRPLGAATSALLGERLAHDVSDVRVHTDGRAAASARALGAQAYTVGRDIVFGQGAYRPDSPSGLRLLGHEVAHVVQQRGTVADLRQLGVETSGGGPAELEADRAGAAIARGRMAPDLSATPGAILARKIVNEDAGGCGVCENAMLAGVQAHMLIQSYLTRQIPGLQREFPLPAQAPGDTTPPGTGSGRLDLCVLTKDEVFIAEIKPSNATQIAQGRRDLLFYFNLIDRNTDDPDLAHRHARLLDLEDIKGPTFIWMFRDWSLLPDPGTPPCLQQLWIEKVQPGLYTYWCEPPGSQLKGTPGCAKCRPKKDKDQPEDTDHPDFPIADELKEAKPKDAPKETPKQPPRPEAEKPKEAPEQEPEKAPESEPEKAPEPKPEKPAGPEGEQPQPDKTPEPEGERPQPDGEGGKGNGRPSGGDRGSGGKGRQRPARPGPPPGPFPFPVPVRPEIPIGIALMAMLVVLAKQLPKKAIGPVVYAEALAMVVLLASGRVEAKPSLEGTDPLEGLYKVMTEKGQPPSPELKQLLESDPKLAEAIRKAARTGDVTAAQEELSKRTMQVIEDNLDQFSDDELEQLLAQQEKAPLPGGEVTVERLKRTLAGRRAGTGSGTGDRKGAGPDPTRPPAPAPAPAPATAEPGPTAKAAPGPAGTPLPREAQARLAAAGAPVERLWRGVTGEGGKGRVPASPELLDEFLRRVSITPPLTDAEVEGLLAAAIPAAETTDRAALLAAVDEAMRALVEARKQPQKNAAPQGDGGSGGADAGVAPSPGPGTPAPGQDTAKPARPVSDMLGAYASLPKGAWRFDPLGPFRFEDKPAGAPVFVAERRPDGTLVGGFTTITVSGPGSGKGHWAIQRGAIEWFDAHDSAAGTSPAGTFDVVPVTR